MYILTGEMNFCVDTSAMWQFVGYIIMIIKIVVPLLIIILGVIDLAKAVTSSDDKAINKAINSVVKRLIAGVVIFFVPTIMSLIFSLVKEASSYIEAADACQSCLLNPTSEDCDNYKITAEEDRKKRSEEPLDTPNIIVPNHDNNYTPSTNEKTYVNSVNKIKYNLYNQADERWASVKYPSGETIKEIGCMISSAAIVLSSNDSTITPKTILDEGYQNHFVSDTINSLGNGAFSCSHYGAMSKEYITGELKKGNPVIIMVYGKNKNGSSKFTSSQHYMALLDIKDDQIFVGNSYGTAPYAKSGWFSTSEVLTSVQEVNVCKPK